MKKFIRVALDKYDKLTKEQVRDILVDASLEIDRLEMSFESLNLGILVCDTNHNLLFTNRSAERLLHVDDYEAGVDNVCFVLRDEEVSQFLYVILPSGEKVFDKEVYIEYGRIQKLVAISVLPLVDEKRIAGSIIVVEDITESREKEAKARNLESLASLTTLSASVAHEIKNPLGAIKIHNQLVEKALSIFKTKFEAANIALAVPFESMEKHLNIINEEIDRLNRIVMDFLLAVRPMSMQFIKSDINRVMTEIVDIVKAELIIKKIKLRVSLTIGLPQVLYDGRYIKQAVLNLIKNSIEAMDEAGGNLTIETMPADTKVIIAIRDTGRGISKENLEKIFAPYFTTKAQGTGLGLTMVFKIIKEHQGEIDVKSKVDSGTSFIISLPAAAVGKKFLEYTNN